MPLSVKDLVVHYGKLEAVRGVSLEVNEGDIVSLLGANGSGKSTIFRTISGIKRPVSGTIHYQGQRIDHMPVPDIVRMGIAQVPEGRRLFPKLTVWENLKMGAFTRGKDKRGVERDIEELYEFLPRLKERSQHRAGLLSGGEQSMVAIARALMAKPKLLLMDEPTQGLAPAIIDEIADVAKRLNREGLTIMIIEHNVQMALDLASKAIILDNGRISEEGDPREISKSEYAQKIYLAG